MSSQENHMVSTYLEQRQDVDKDPLIMEGRKEQVMTDRKAKDRERRAKRTAAQTPQQKEEKRIRQRDRKKAIHEAQTPKQREERLAKRRDYIKAWRRARDASLTLEQLKERNAKAVEKVKAWRATQSPEERERALIKRRAYIKSIRESLTPEQNKTLRLKNKRSRQKHDASGVQLKSQSTVYSEG
jgi:hypothetical protein